MLHCQTSCAWNLDNESWNRMEAFQKTAEISKFWARHEIGRQQTATANDRVREDRTRRREPRPATGSDCYTPHFIDLDWKWGSCPFYRSPPHRLRPVLFVSAVRGTKKRTMLQSIDVARANRRKDRWMDVSWRSSQGRYLRPTEIRRCACNCVKEKRQEVEFESVRFSERRISKTVRDRRVNTTEHLDPRGSLLSSTKCNRWIGRVTLSWCGPAHRAWPPSIETKSLKNTSFLDSCPYYNLQISVYIVCNNYIPHFSSTHRHHSNSRMLRPCWHSSRQSLGSILARVTSYSDLQVFPLVTSPGAAHAHNLIHFLVRNSPHLGIYPTSGSTSKRPVSESVRDGQSRRRMQSVG